MKSIDKQTIEYFLNTKTEEQLKALVLLSGDSEEVIPFICYMFDVCKEVLKELRSQIAVENKMECN